SAEMAILYLIDEFEFDLDKLKASLGEKGLNISFSNVKYPHIAAFIGLDSLWKFSNAPSFELCHSQIPTAFFKDIVMDMDVLLIQYGTLQDHTMEEARSCFLAPIFNCLVAQFGSSIWNKPESLMNGHIMTRGRIEYHFKTFSALTVIFVEMKLQIGSVEESLNAIAQVIAECNACDWSNMQVNVSMLIYSILCDGSTFQFFSFDGSTKPYKFSMGVAPGNCFCVAGGLPLVDFLSESTAHPFIHSLYPICTGKTIFNLLLVTYITSLKVFRNRSTSQHGQRKSLDGWSKALKFAEEALEKSQTAEALCKDNLIIDADATAEAALKALRLRYNFCQNFFIFPTS
ncbi:uncharacterized protein EDB91DRAFT_1058963, partial [Suillus paluster]|uniref:uncharacterized protein n=1 Tax=Suillus paluster TaxID=48578 RepID=UPI001B883D90